MTNPVAVLWNTSTCFFFAVALYLPMLHCSAVCTETTESLPDSSHDFLAWPLLIHGGYTQYHTSASPVFHSSLSLELKPLSVIAPLCPALSTHPGKVYSWATSMFIMSVHHQPLSINSPEHVFLWASSQPGLVVLEQLCWESLSITCSYLNSQKQTLKYSL